MKLVHSAPYGIALCFSAAMLADCGGALSQIGSPAALPQASTQRNATADYRRPGSSTEVLTTSHVEIHHSCRECLPSTIYFNATGTAEGLRPGTFTASGNWSCDLSEGCRFDEWFTITSGSSSSGTIYATWPSGQQPFKGSEFGPATVKYELKNGGHGRVGIKIIDKSDFHEKFFNFTS
jgi:hypothetical protein